MHSAMIKNSQNLRFFTNCFVKRTFSVQAAAIEKPIKYEDAKPFSQVPTLSKLQLGRSFLPGGRYYKAPFSDLVSLMNKEFGNIFLMPGMFGKDPVLLIFDPVDFETLLRNEGIWPNRKNSETLEYYRLKVRPDIYGEVGGLFNE